MPFEVVDVELGPRVEPGRQQQHPQAERLAHARDRADDDAGEHEGDVDPAAALVGAERDRVEQVDLALLQQRPGRLLALGDGLVTHPQDQPARVLVVGAFGPDAAERPPQP